MCVLFGSLFFPEGVRSTPTDQPDSTQTSKTRRLLPQVPPGERQDGATPSILIRSEPSPDAEPSETTAWVPDSGPRLRLPEDVDHDSLSDTSRSDDSSVLDRRATPKCTSFYIGSGKSRSGSPKALPTTVLIRHLSGSDSRRPVKQNLSAPNLQTQDEDSRDPKKEAQSSGFVRQESFTKDRHGDDKRLPHISSHPALPDLGRKVGEADEAPQHLQTAEDLISEDSDVDTASTVSLVSSKNAPDSTPKLRPSSSAAPSKKSSEAPSQEKPRQVPSARQRLSEKRRNHVVPEKKNLTNSAPPWRLHLRRSAGPSGSLDLSPAPPTKAPAHQVLTRSNSLSAPRPTRASMLRRARLADNSDNESVETDHASQTSEHTTGHAHKLSRLDVLALPRKRTGSLSATANETVSKQANASGRKMSAGETKLTNRISPVTEKNSSSRVRSNHAKHASAIGEYKIMFSDGLLLLIFLLLFLDSLVLMPCSGYCI